MTHVLKTRSRGWALRLVAVLAGSSLPAVPLEAQDTTARTPAIDSSWLRYDAATKTVHFHLIAGLTGRNGALNFNGFDDGDLVLVVPAGSKVVMDFSNHDGMLPHSAEIIQAKTPVPTTAVSPAIPRATTSKIEEGLPPQGTDQMTFTAKDPGKYFIFCGVPGHGQSGMYITLEVSADAKEPSMHVMKE